jgi:hypothetical protein
MSLADILLLSLSHFILFIYFLFFRIYQGVSIYEGNYPLVVIPGRFGRIEIGE